MKSTAELKKKLDVSHTYQVFEPWIKSNGFDIKDLPLVATNEDGETVIVEICGSQDGEYIWKTSTLQNNNWMRINIYYPDSRIEELYER